MTLTPRSLVPQIPKFQCMLECLVVLLLGIVILCGVEAFAETVPSNNPRLLEKPDQGRNTTFSSIETREERSHQDPVDWYIKQVSGRVVGDVEVEMVEADPLYKPMMLGAHAVLTSAKNFLPQNLKRFSDLYFDENRSLMGDRESGTMEEIAHILRDEPESSLFVDAYCDERGAAAYSLMLGDRHAHQVQTYFIHLGLQPDRISPLSYGEEKIWCHEHNALCWEANLLLKHVFRLMAPNDPLNGCLIRLALTAGSHRFSDPSQIHRNSPLQRLRLAHSP